MSKKKKMLLESASLPDTDYMWGSSLDAAFFTAITDRLSKPINQWAAFKVGIINSQGRVLRYPKTREERRAFSYMDQLALFIRMAAGGRTSQIYNMYRKARMDPEFVKASARARSFRFLKYYDLASIFAENPTPIIGGHGNVTSTLEKPFG